jgi:hypothetical protein
MTPREGAWQVKTIDGADVRLRSGKVGLMDLDVSAPVSGGHLRLTEDAVHLTLHLDLGSLRTHFLLQSAARKIVSRNNAVVLSYAGEGMATALPWHVTGHAKAGSVDVELELAITPCGPATDPMAEIEVSGSASLGEVNLPLPGLGRIDDFAFDVDGKFALSARS